MNEISDNPGNTVNDQDLGRLRARCEFAANFWWCVVSGLTAVTYRDKGEQALHKLWYRILSGHQGTHYREGLRKLGIEGDLPAVTAAKYHYFSNSLGGLRMHYIEESPKKVWIRYLGPNGTYPGIAMLAIPAAVRRTVFTAWHPRNGELMGCPRLGWVLTKTTMEGEPYDEGYFQEYDDDLPVNERVRFETVIKSPEFDPDKAPKLDPVAWPEERRLKAKRRFAEGYVVEAVEGLQEMFGGETTNYLLQQAMGGIAVQFTPSFLADLGIQSEGLEAVEALFTGILDACFDNFEVERPSPRRLRIVRHGFQPFVPETPEGLRQAFFHFHETAVRMIDGRIRIARRPDGDVEQWEIEDMGRWLW